jgi:hypothetical protein
LSDTAAGKIVTFYSYKGGTGRSMALANFACWLATDVVASPGRVLLVDWDLEAPGLHRYFAEKAETPENADRPGLIDFFWELRARLDAEPPLGERLRGDDRARALREELRTYDYIVSDVAPGVDLIKAGRFGADYARLVSAFDWVEFYEKHGGVFRALRELASETYAYTLIDSRTGFNDVSGICTMLMPEKLVLVFTPNRQNLSGVVDLAARAVDYRIRADDFRPLGVFPLPSRIENAEQSLKKDWREQYQKAFEATLKNIYQLDGCDLSAYFDDVLLPHVSFYAYGEELALLREKHSDALSLSRAYESFFRRLEALEFPWDTFEDSGQTDETPSPIVPARRPDESLADIYISYSHIDNQPSHGETVGWVDVFHDVLKLELSKLLGRTDAVKIWRDTRLVNNRSFDEVIEQQLAAATLFIPILSPAYLRSEFCRHELEAFQRHATKSPEGLFVGDRSRVLPVWIRDVSRAALPEPLDRIIGYRFYKLELERGRGLGLPHQPGQDEFSRNIYELANDIVLTLRAKQAMNEAGAEEAPPEVMPCVYLAEVVSALRGERERIRNELLRRGVIVIPDGPLPFDDGAACGDAVRSYLQRCALSVHLVGDEYGLVPEGETRSVVELQYDLAAERGKESRFERLVCILGKSESSDERQRLFVEKLESVAPRGGGLQLLRMSVGELVNRVMTTLKQLAASGPPPVEATPDSPGVAFIDIHHKDSDLLSQLLSVLMERRYEMRLLPDTDSPLENVSRFEEAVKQANVFIFAFGEVHRDWVAQRLTTTWKLAVKHDAQQLKLLGVYTGSGPGSEERLAVVSSLAQLIPVFGFDRPEKLKAELDRIEKG